MNTLVLLQAEAANGGMMGGNLIMLLAFALVFWFCFINPSRKKQKEEQNFRDQIKPGDSVITAGGIYGKVKQIDNNIVVLEIANNVNIRISKNSIYQDSTATTTSK